MDERLEYAIKKELSKLVYYYDYDLYYKDIVKWYAKNVLGGLDANGFTLDDCSDDGLSLIVRMAMCVGQGTISRDTLVDHVRKWYNFKIGEEDGKE